MIGELTYLVDLDDTLVFTRDLNNDAYNYALELHGYERIKKTARITRKDIKLLCYKNISKIIRAKQEYFCQSWMSYRLTLNSDLMYTLKMAGRENCLLWTAADKKRALKIVSLYGLKQYFSKIIFDNKLNLEKSITRIKSNTNTNYIVAIDDSADFSNIKTNYRALDFCKLESGKFNVNAWLICFKYK